MVRKATWLLVVLLPALAAAGVAGVAVFRRHAQETQTLTRLAPDAGTIISSGMNLNGVGGVRVTACSRDGGTLNGGTLRAYLYVVEAAKVSRNPDKDLGVGTPGGACRTWDDVQISAKHGDYAFWSTDTVTVVGQDAGQVIIYLDAWGE